MGAHLSVPVCTAASPLLRRGGGGVFCSDCESEFPPICFLPDRTPGDSVRTFLHQRSGYEALKKRRLNPPKTELLGEPDLLCFNASFLPRCCFAGARGRPGAEALGPLGAPRFFPVSVLGLLLKTRFVLLPDGAEPPAVSEWRRVKPLSQRCPFTGCTKWGMLCVFPKTISNLKTRPFVFRDPYNHFHFCFHTRVVVCVNDVTTLTVCVVRRC